MTDSKPLAERFRPRTLDEIAGQALPKRLIKTMLDNDRLTSMIFFGPAGCGKTTLAHVIANQTARPMSWLNATTATVKDLRVIVDASDGPVVVYLDEIQYWNKKQQQSLLSFVEDGSVTLIAATTENPWHGIYDALLSRLTVIEFSPVAPEDVRARLDTVLDELGDARLAPEARDAISRACTGDMRRALTLADAALSAYPDADEISVDDIRELIPSMNMSGFDTLGIRHRGSRTSSRPPRGWASRSRSPCL